VAIERGGAAVRGVSISKLNVASVAVAVISVRAMSVEQRSHSSVSVVMVVAISIVQTGFAQHALNFLAQRVGNERGVPFAASDAAYVGGVDIELNGDALVDTAKYGERFKRVRDTIRLVTIHDFLVVKRRSKLTETVTTLTRMVSLIG
jgi:hypothetical protein